MGNEIELYSVIDELSAKTFIADLRSINGQATVRINNGGGYVFSGLAIYNAIKQRGQVTTKIDGLAASIASLIAVGGSRVEAASNSLIMVHNPWSSSAGSSEELRKQADTLDKVKSAMIQAYTAKTGMSEAQISKIMDDETWFTAEEALDAKLIDAIYDPIQISAHYVGIERYQLPTRILAHMNTNNPKPQNQNPDTQAALIQENANMKAELARQGEIKASFGRFAHFEGVADIMNDCLTNPAISHKAAIEVLMDKLGQGVSPTGVHFAHRVNSDGSLQDGYQNNFQSQFSSVQFGPNNHHDEFILAATDALLIKNGIKLSRTHPAARDIINMSLNDIAQTMISQAGSTIRGGLFGIKRGQDVIKAALTSSDFPLLLENVTNKALMNGYETEPASHTAWVNKTDVPDFKMQKRVALSEAPGLEVVGEAGEYKYGSMREKGTGFKLETFGKIISLTRQMLINDDLSALTKIPNALGRSAARLEADKVYAILVANPTMADGTALFHADHKNLMAAAALSVASLGLARAAMRKQVGLNGGFLNVVPKFLIVPAALESTAEQLVATLVDPSKTNNTSQFAWIRSLEIVVDARLDAASATAWHLAADYNQVDTIELAYLQGQRGAFISQEENFDSDALKIKCRLDFQASPIDWLGLIKNPGA